ncbi:MAG: TRAP transporter large permease subunit, partial [Gammaproteobacteria bacterium]
TITACYIFLAIVLAPPLVAAGFDPVAVHLFMLYWGMVSFITPPVALAAFVASGLAGAPPIKVGLQSMRLGSIMYIVPFFFVLNPALIMRGDAGEILVVVLTAIIGILLLASALEGYLVGLGPLRGSAFAFVGRLLLAAGGLMLALPGGGDLGLSHLQLSVVGVVVAAIGAAVGRLGSGAAARA